MIFISPNINAWYRIYLALQKIWEASGKKGEPPPIALILQGWEYSTDYQKQERWQNTIKWASQHGVDNQILQLAEEDKYYVEALGGAPAEGSEWTWVAEPASCPSENDLQEAISRLKANWHQVAGSELAQCTIPIRFTGKKRRRLVVKVICDITPPWGSWYYISSGNDKRDKFTQFRQAVNRCIAPVEVDHVDFTLAIERNNQDVEQQNRGDRD